MQRESSHLAHCGIERLIATRQSLQGVHLAARVRAHRDAIRDRVVQRRRFKYIHRQPEQDVELAGLIEDVALLLDPSCRQHQVEIIRHPPPAGVFGLSDGVVRQVLFNVLGNAIKFSPPDGNVTVTTRVELGQLTISITDHGPGILPADEERIFEPFYTNAPAGSTSLGLGLPVSRNLLEGVGGSLGFDSTPGKATTFHIRIPVVRKDVNGKIQSVA